MISAERIRRESAWTAPAAWQMPQAIKLPWAVRFVLLYLITITVLGKGPTYLIYPPLFWGEMVMVAGILWMINQNGALNALLPVSDGLTWSVIAFCAIGAYITLTYVPMYGMEAIRDAAIWYYAAFFFIGAHIARNEAYAASIWRILRFAWMGALCWGVASMASNFELNRIGPVLPWRGEPLLSNSHYELVQHMGLAALIILNKRWSADILRTWRPYVLPAGFIGLGYALSSAGRGVKLGLLLAIAVMLPMKFAPGSPLEISKRLLAILAVIVILALTISVFFEEEAQAVAKIVHLDRFAGADPSSPTGTAYWRLIWWKRLVHEVMARDPLFGLGFGESLNVYNPYLRGDEKTKWPVRSPHNFNVTVFSRMGLTGGAMWGLVLGIGLIGLWMRVWRGHCRGTPYTRERREELAFWIMMLIATLVNASFGVLMEGPVLGVWFWFALGFAWMRSRVDLTAGRGRMEWGR